MDILGDVLPEFKRKKKGRKKRVKKRRVVETAFSQSEDNDVNKKLTKEQKQDISCEAWELSNYMDLPPEVE